MIKGNTYATYQTSLSNGTHTIISDEPTSNGGTDMGFTPHELLEASLASCTNITLRMYIDRSKWSVDEIDVTVSTDRTIGQPITLKKHVNIHGTIDQKQLDRLLYIANKCPIHKILEKTLPIISTIEKI